MNRAASPMTAKRREELLAACERHARRFALDAERRSRGGPVQHSRPPREATVAARGLRPSGRQLEVLRLIADGSTNHEIAMVLHLSDETVKSHVHELAARLGARSRAHTVSLGYRYGLLAVEPLLHLEHR